MMVASIWGYYADNPMSSTAGLLPWPARYGQAKPNAAHFSPLAELEQIAQLKLLVTQNIDGLHQTAGSRHVVELHGHLRTASCLACAEQTALEDHRKAGERGEVPRCQSCGGLIKPDVILLSVSRCPTTPCGRLAGGCAFLRRVDLYGHLSGGRAGGRSAPPGHAGTTSG